MNQNSIDLIRAVMDDLTHEEGIPGALRDHERRRGFQVVAVGERWLSPDDWHTDTVVTLAGQEVRLLLLRAHQERQGAFTRLVAAIQTDGLVPVVVCPTDRLMLTLYRHGWVAEERGEGIERETLFMPGPPGAEPPLSYFWLSFVDRDRPKGQRSLGAIFMQGDDIAEVLARSRVLGIHPGGEVAAWQCFFPRSMRIPLPLDKLLSRAECEQFGRVMTGNDAPHPHVFICQEHNKP